MKKKQFLLALFLVPMIMSCSHYLSGMKLHNGRYTYKQIKARGYICEPFKGTHYIRFTSDSAKVDITVKP